jgi:hypothetical protein
MGSDDVANPAGELARAVVHDDPKLESVRFISTVVYLSMLEGAISGDFIDHGH